MNEKKRISWLYKKRWNGKMLWNIENGLNIPIEVKQSQLLK